MYNMYDLQLIRRHIGFHFLKCIAVATAVLLPSYVSAGKSIFGTVVGSEKKQAVVINDCADNSHYYGDNDIQRLSYLCVRAFLSVLSQDSYDPQKVLVRPNTPGTYIFGIYTEWSKERVEQERKKAEAWFNEYPFILDQTDNENEYLQRGYLVITYECELHGVEMRIRLGAEYITPDLSQIAEQAVDYDFHIAYTEDACDNADFKEALKDFKEYIKDDIGDLVDNDGILLEGYEDELGWKLCDIEIFKPTFKKVTSEQ